MVALGPLVISHTPTLERRLDVIRCVGEHINTHCHFRHSSKCVVICALAYAARLDVLLYNSVAWLPKEKI